MACPYIGTFSGARPARKQPDINNVCHARPNPQWSYAPVDTEAQAHYCFSRSYGRCPRYETAKSQNVSPPAAAAGKGFSLFGLFRRSA